MGDIENIKKEAELVLSEADLLYTGAEVDAAIEKMAVDISTVLCDKNPIVLCLMVGAVIPVGKLLPLLQFPLQLEYVHATRYRGDTSGGELHWIKKPGIDMNNRTVLIVDDILDEGITLTSTKQVCQSAGAGNIYTAVLVDKQIGKQRGLTSADFTGLTVPDRYVFGSGMDYKNYLRNCAGIYAVKNK